MSRPPSPSLRSADSEPSDSPTRFLVEPWSDPVLDALGHDPRSPYVERFWLGVLGPTSTLLMRHLATRFDGEPDGFELDARTAARALGVGHKSGRHSPLVRAIARCIQFKLVQRPAAEKLAVRRMFPPLTLAQVERLPAPTRRAHDRWQMLQLRRSDHGVMERRARRLASSLLELGEPPERVRDELERRSFAPDLARAGVEWAVQQDDPVDDPAGDPPPAA